MTSLPFSAAARRDAETTDDGQSVISESAAVRAEQAGSRPDQATPPKPEAPDRRAEQRRRILSAAMACFARDGFHAASMQKICAEAGMSPGALYRYFRSKEELIAAIVADERSDRQHILDSVLQAPSVLDALSDCLRIMLEDDVLPTARLGPEIMAEAIRNTRLRAIIEPSEEESRTQMRDALAAAVARGEIDPALDIDDILVMLHALADGLLLHHQLHPAWDLPRRITTITALMRRMLAPPQAG